MISGCLFVFFSQKFLVTVERQRTPPCFLAVSHTLSAGIPDSSYGGSSKQQQGAKGSRREEMHIAKKTRV
jgi:hypothetical protein